MVNATSRISLALIIAIIMAARGYKRKSLDFSGAIAAFFVGCIAFTANLRFGLVLIGFFLSSSKLTKFGHERKMQIEDGYEFGEGNRNWIQVLANAGFSSSVALYWIYTFGLDDYWIDTENDFTASILTLSYVAHFACCNGDTWSSELGVLSKSSPRLITTCRKVPPGTNGGVTLLGTAAAVGGGLFIGLVAYLAAFLGATSVNQVDATQVPAQWPLILFGACGGLFGSVLDSLLGATIQYSGFDTKKNKIVEHNKTNNNKHISGLDILDNHAVNFVAALGTAIILPFLVYKFKILA